MYDIAVDFRHLTSKEGHSVYERDYFTDSDKTGVDHQCLQLHKGESQRLSILMSLLNNSKIG